MFIHIVFWLSGDSPSGLPFFRARFTSFHTHASLLSVFVCLFVLFHSCCSHARVFWKILVHKFPISYSHTEWYFIFSLFGAEKLNMPSRHYYSHYSWSGRNWTCPADTITAIIPEVAVRTIKFKIPKSERNFHFSVVIRNIGYENSNNIMTK